jgi:hypothetical protein
MAEDPNAVPPPWQDVASDPAFAQAPPEDKLVAFSRWHDAAFNAASSMPDWEQHKDNFNQSAAEIQDDLSKAAGGITPDQARAKIGKQAIDAAGATDGPSIREALRAQGPDIWKAYLDDHAKPVDDGTTSIDKLTMAQRADPVALAKAASQTNPARVIGSDVISGLENTVSGVAHALQPTETKNDLSLVTNQFLKDASDYWKDAAAKTPAQFGVDPSKEGDISTVAAHTVAGLGLVMGEAAVAPELFLVQNAFQRYGETFNQTGDESKAQRAAAISLISNKAFQELSPIIGRRIGSALPEAFGDIRKWATIASGQTAGNVTVGQLTKAADAASQAPEGEKLQAFGTALNDLAPADLGVAAGFGMLVHGEPTKGTPPLPEVAKASPEDEARAQALEAAKAPMTADADRQDAIARRADALRQAASPELQAQARAANTQEDLITGTFPPEPVASTTPLVSHDTPEGTTHVVSPDATLEQLKDFKAKVDLSHLSPEEKVDAHAQLDARIAELEQQASGPGTRIVGPALVDENGKMLAQGKNGMGHGPLAGTIDDHEAALRALTNDDQHVFIDDKGNQLNRVQAAELGVKSGQLPADFDTAKGAQSHDFKPDAAPVVSSAIRAGRTYNTAALPTDREIALLNQRTPKEKADQIEKGIKQVIDDTLNDGLLPSGPGAHGLTGDAKAGRIAREEAARQLAEKYPPAPLPEGAKETTAKTGLGDTVFKSVIDAEGKVTPAATNDPATTAAEIDRGGRVVYPADMVEGDKLNPAIQVTLDPKTNEYVATSADVRLPDGKVAHITGPDEYTNAYDKAMEGKRALTPYFMDEETLTKVADEVKADKDLAGVLPEDFHFNTDKSAFLDKETAGTPENPTSQIEGEKPLIGDKPSELLTKKLIENMTVLNRVGLATPLSTGPRALFEGLRKIALDSTATPGQRWLAKQLASAGEAVWKGVKLQLVHEPLSKCAGQYTGGEDVKTGEILINSSVGHKDGVLSSLLHEAVHHLTLAMTDPEYDRNPFQQKAYENILSHKGKLLEFAFTKETGRVGTPDQLNAFAEAQGGETLLPNGDRNPYAEKDEYYAFSDTGNFISEILSSDKFNKFVDEYDAAHPAKKEGIGKRIVRELMNLFAAEKIEPGSLRANAIEDAYKMLRQPQENERTPWGRQATSEAKAGPGRGFNSLDKLSLGELKQRYIEKYGEGGPDLETWSKKELQDALNKPLQHSNAPAPTDIAGTFKDDGWFAPTLKFHPNQGGSHEMTADDIIKGNPKMQARLHRDYEKYGDTGSLGYLYDLMYDNGYVRVVSEGKGRGETTTYIQGNPSDAQLRALKDAAIEHKVKLVQDDTPADVTEEGSHLLRGFRTIYDPNSSFVKAAQPTAPTIVHETDETGKTTTRVNIPEGAKAEELRATIARIDANPRLPEDTKTQMKAQLGAKLETYKIDQGATRFAQLQDEIAGQPGGKATDSQSAELAKIKADLPAVIDHPAVQKSAQALGIVPGYMDVNDMLWEKWNGVRNYIGSREPAEYLSAWYNAARNNAVLFSRQVGNNIRGALREAMSRDTTAPGFTSMVKDVVKGAGRFVGVETKARLANAQDERALSFVVEAQGDVAKLDEMRQKIKAALATPNDFGARWGRMASKALDAIDHATDNFARLSIAADAYHKATDNQVKLENTNGVATNYRKGYVPHLQEMMSDAEDAVLFGSDAGSTSGTGFKKMRYYDTFADSIAAGVIPKTLNAVDALENRVKRGSNVINLQKWAEAGKTLIDPSSKLPVIGNVVIDEHPTTGEKQTSPPPGYVLKLMGNRQIAVNSQYAGLFNALTEPSRIRDNPIGAMALSTTGTVKHGLLLFDTFHLGRLAYYMAPLRGKTTFSRGLLSLDYSDAELQNMERRGDLPSNVTSQDLIARKGQLQRLVDAGYNLGGIQEAVNAGFTRKIPFFGDFNKFVFEQYQRGGMVETGLHELERQTAAFPELSPEEVARKVSKELNTRFGNLQKEGWLKSDTAADIAQLVLLAPYWNEGLLKSEYGSVKQLAKAGKDLTLGYKDENDQRVRTLRAGALLKGSAVTMLGTFVMNQIINYGTRQQPTWQNKEEGIDSKISAWIPDKIGGGPGFFLSPFALPMEITHQVIDAEDQGKTTLQAMAQVAKYKFSPVVHAGLALGTQTDRFGRPLRDATDVMKEMATDLTPLPIAATSAYAAVKGMAEGKVTEPFKGAIEKQSFAVAGIKLVGAPSDAARIGRLATKYMKAHNAARDPRYDVSDYQNLKQAIETNDPKRAQKEYTVLAKTKTAKVIDDHFRKQVSHPFTGDKKMEAKFRDSLTKEQDQTYEKALDAREKLRDTYLDMNLTAPEKPED